MVDCPPQQPKRNERRSIHTLPTAVHSPISTDTQSPSRSELPHRHTDMPYGTTTSAPDNSTTSVSDNALLRDGTRPWENVTMAKSSDVKGFWEGGNLSSAIMPGLGVSSLCFCFLFVLYAKRQRRRGFARICCGRLSLDWLAPTETQPAELTARETLELSTIAAIHALPSSPWPEEESAFDCALCLEPVVAGVSVVMHMPRCSHAFHANCVRRWLAEGQRYRERRCPLCREIVVGRSCEAPEGAPGPSATSALSMPPSPAPSDGAPRAPPRPPHGPPEGGPRHSDRSEPAADAVRASAPQRSALDSPVTI